MDVSQFHFLRPDWFWALIPAAALFWLILRNRGVSERGAWAAHVDAHLLKHLAVSGKAVRTSFVVPTLAAVAVIGLVVALAGPTWKRAEVPSFVGDEPVVVVLSLTQSMNSTDLTPSRLKRGVHKLRDILDRTQGDDRALVIYSDIPFVAAPLTSDPKVIEQMLPELSTRLMPVLGNRPDLAVAEASAVLERAGAASGRIVLIADSAGDAGTTAAAAAAASRAGYSVSVLAVGTEDGATLQTADGRPIASQSGEEISTSLDVDGLRMVARSGGGDYAVISAGGSDLNRLLPETDALAAAGQEQEFMSDVWIDMGYWLLIIPALLLPFAFRRGMVFGLALLVVGLGAAPDAAKAGTWDDLWATRDQQGQAAFRQGDFEAAAVSFETPAWKGSAAYRAGQYDDAAGDFAGDDYNLGNALAKSGRFEAAIAAYDRVLARTPDDADARFNRDLIQKLLDEQKQQEEQQQSQDQQDQQEQQQSSGSGESEDQPTDGGSGQQQQQQSSGEESGSEQAQGDQGQGDQGQEGSDQAEQAGSQSSSQGGADENAGQQADAGEATPDNGGQESQDSARDRQASQGQPSGSDEQPEQAGQPSGQDQTARRDETGALPDQQSEAAEADHTDTDQNSGASEQAAGEPTDEESSPGLSQLISDLLNGNGEEEPTENVAASVPGAPVTDQAVEQQLRRVPDDPSGLLKARIRQHYVQLRAAQ